MVLLQNCELNRSRLGYLLMGISSPAEFSRIQLLREFVGRVECSKSRGQFLQLLLATRSIDCTGLIVTVTLVQQ